MNEKKYKITLVISEKITENITKEIVRFSEDYDYIKEWNEEKGTSILEIELDEIINKIGKI